MSIGRAAHEASVTTRTLRYYEQLGLVTPVARSVGGARRYAAADLERVARIRQLQDLLGHDLEQVGRVLRAEDRLAELRAEWRSDEPVDGPARRSSPRRSTSTTASGAQVRARQGALASFADGLEEKARLYRKVAKELRDLAT